jgi:hypothetical protein
MALLRPRQFGSNTPNPHSQPTQNTQPGLPSSMTFPTTFTGIPDPFATSSSTSSVTQKTTLKSTTSGRIEPSSTQSQSPGSSTNSIPSSTNTLPAAASAGDSSAYGSSTTLNSGNAPSSTSSLASTTLGAIGASASSSSSFSASTTSAGMLTGAEVKCSSLSCNPGKAAAIFVPIAIVFALLALCIAFFCVRRKGRARLGQGLAFFSHGAETNYVSASASSAGNSRAPSMREAESSYGPLAAGAGLGAAGAAGLAAARGNRQNHDHDFGLGFVPDTLSRSSSDAHCAAPPPYAPRQSNEMNHDAVEPADITRHSPLAAPAAAHTTSDPFADTPNPFTDDAAENASLLSGDTAVNRGIGSRRSVRDNASIVSSLQDVDEAGSVCEAQVANVSRGPSLSIGAGGRSRPGGSS